jgi:hypothetical protein
MSLGYDSLCCRDEQGGCLYDACTEECEDDGGISSHLLVHM